MTPAFRSVPSDVAARASLPGYGCPASVALFSCSKLALISRSVPRGAQYQLFVAVDLLRVPVAVGLLRGGGDLFRDRAGTEPDVGLALVLLLTATATLWLLGRGYSEAVVLKVLNILPKMEIRCRFIFSGKNDELTLDFSRMMN